MRKFLLVILVSTAVGHAHARTIEENILVRYPLVLERLQVEGFYGPFGEEVAKFAMLRQIIEDGPTREHSVSIVGMCPGGLNKQVMNYLGLIPGNKNNDGLVLRTVDANDGQRSYAIYGPRANVTSTVAIALLWDRYVNEMPNFKPEEKHAWNESKAISEKLAKGETSGEVGRAVLTCLAGETRKALAKANRMYGSLAAGEIQRMVSDMEPLFELAVPSKFRP
jgi:hypothetical protein